MNRKVCFERMPMLQNEYYKLGLFFPNEFSVEPRTMVHRVREILIKKWGLDFVNNTTIVDCQIKNGICEVVSSKGEKFYAEKVAICNGRDFKALFPSLFENSGMKVSKLNMMSTYPLKDVQIKGNILSGLSIRRYDSFKSCAHILKYHNQNGKNRITLGEFTFFSNKLSMAQLLLVILMNMQV
jgi:glycine/D-amino acid oxidase-like deaminating enzyme